MPYPPFVATRTRAAQGDDLSVLGVPARFAGSSVSGAYNRVTHGYSQCSRASTARTTSSTWTEPTRPGALKP